jgi:hypothetical protein
LLVSAGIRNAVEKLIELCAPSRANAFADRESDRVRRPRRRDTVGCVEWLGETEEDVPARSAAIAQDQLPIEKMVGDPNKRRAI